MAFLARVGAKRGSTMMNGRLFMWLSCALMLAGCVANPATTPQDTADSSEQAPSTLSFKHRLTGGSDWMLTVGARVPTNVSYSIAFENLTTNEGQNSPGWGYTAINHNATERQGTRWWEAGDGRHVVELFHGGYNVTLGPQDSLDPVVGGIGAREREVSFVGRIAADPHMHLLISTDAASADVTVTLHGEGPAPIEVEDDRAVGDRSMSQVTSNPSGWDEKTEIWTDAAGVLDAKTTFNVTSTLNEVLIINSVGSGYRYGVDGPNGFRCDWMSHTSWPYSAIIPPFTVRMFQIPPGDYQAQITLTTLFPAPPVAVLWRLEWPGHEPIRERSPCT